MCYIEEELNGPDWDPSEDYDPYYDDLYYYDPQAETMEDRW